MNRNVGVRPWQILLDQPIPQFSTQQEYEDAKQVPPPWRASEFNDSTYLSPIDDEWDPISEQAKRVMRAVAVDMALIKLRPFVSEPALVFRETAESLVDLIIEYPYVESPRKRAIVTEAERLIQAWDDWRDPNIWYGGTPSEFLDSGISGIAESVCEAVLTLADNVIPRSRLPETRLEMGPKPADYAISAGISALADIRTWGGGVTMHWPFRYPGQASDFANKVNRIVSLWWEEVKRVLAFRDWETARLD